MGHGLKAKDSVKSANCLICRDGASAKVGPTAIRHQLWRKRLFS